VHSWLTDQATDLQSKFTELKGNAAMLALPKYKQDLEDRYQDALKLSGNPQTQAMVAAQARRTLDNFKEIGTRHADTQRDQWATRTAKDAADRYGNEAAIYATHAMWGEMDRSLFNSGQEVRNHFEPQGYDKDTIKTEARSATERTSRPSWRPLRRRAIIRTRKKSMTNTKARWMPVRASRSKVICAQAAPKAKAVRMRARRPGSRRAAARRPRRSPTSRQAISVPSNARRVLTPDRAGT